MAVQYPYCNSEYIKKYLIGKLNKDELDSVITHIAGCEHCYSQVRVVSEMEKLLDSYTQSKGKSRHIHRDRIQLFARGMLPDDGQEEAARHIFHCNTCFTELVKIELDLEREQRIILLDIMFLIIQKAIIDHVQKRNIPGLTYIKPVKFSSPRMFDFNSHRLEYENRVIDFCLFKDEEIISLVSVIESTGIHEEVLKNTIPLHFGYHSEDGFKTYTVECDKLYLPRESDTRTWKIIFRLPEILIDEFIRNMEKIQQKTKDTVIHDSNNKGKKTKTIDIYSFSDQNKTIKDLVLSLKKARLSKKPFWFEEWIEAGYRIYHFFQKIDYKIDDANLIVQLMTEMKYFIKYCGLKKNTKWNCFLSRINSLI